MTEHELGVGRPVNSNRGSARREPPPAGPTEARLHARVAELEARLSEVSRCLVDAENRAAERQRAVEELDRRYTVIATSRSWRMTRALRAAGGRVRDLFRR